MNVSSGMLKASQKRTKRARLLGGLDVEHAGQLARLVADHADRAPVQAREADDQVLGEVLVDLEELAVVDDQAAPRRACRRACSALSGTIESSASSIRSGSSPVSMPRRQLEVVLGQERHEVARVLEARLLVVGGEVRHARLRVVGHGAAELLELDLLAGDRLDHVGARDEHVRGLLDHEDEVGHGRGVDGAARARAHDQRDLRDHARSTGRCARTRRRRRRASRRPPGCGRRPSR